MNAPADVDQFVSRFERSGLDEEGRLDAYLDGLRAARAWPGSAGELAELLIRAGLLTHYQAEQLLIGKHRDFLIGGKYKVLERLGAGGMASVYLCEHRVMRRPVALKILPPGAGDAPPALERFRREARAVAQLNHPNIVAAHDIDQHGPMHFLVMEYVDGINLEDHVAGFGPMDPLRAAHYIEQAARGLEHAHRAGLVHRDIKPSNLLVDRAGVVKVLDLGLARFAADEVDHLTKAADRNLILGTLDFMAPEQARDSHAVDIRADIYGLGATFYFLLTGRGLYGDATPAQKLAAQQYSQPVPLRGLRADVPEGLAAIIDRMLEKDPARRFPTPEELLRALRPWTREPVAPQVLPAPPRMSPAALSAIRRRSDVQVPPALDATGPWPDSSTPTLPAGFPLSGFAAPSRVSATQALSPTRAGKPPEPAGRRRAWAIGAGGLLAVALVAATLWSRSPPASIPAPPAAPDRPNPLAKFNSIGMLLVLIPAGDFFMGSAGTDQGAEAPELPRHHVTLVRPFYTRLG